MTNRTWFSGKHTIVLLVTLCMQLAVLSNEALWAEAEEVPLRVALIDTGDKPSVPPALLDLLVVRLSQEKGLTVLERQEINAMLREQGRNLALADDKVKDDLVAAGRILGADALVLLSAEPMSAQGLQSIEARIVETGRGVRFGKTVLMWSKDAQAITKQIDSAAEQIASRLRRVQKSKGKFTVVSLAGFRTNELSQEAHRFRRSIESWLESWLASQPGIAVAERTKVLPLIAERKLASDLPASLGESDIAIDGTFKIDFSEKPPQVELTLRVLRKDRSVATRLLRAPISEQAKLRESAGKAILEMLAIKPTETSFDAEAEAKLLTDEAERLLTLWRRYEALDRLVTAYALDPNSLRTQSLLLHAGVQLGVGPDPSGAAFERPFYSTALFLSDIARQLLDQIEQEHLPQSDLEFYQRDYLLGRIGEFCSLMSQIQFVVKKPSKNQLIQHEWLRAAVNDLFLQYLALIEIDGGGPYEGAIYKGLQSGRYWAKNPEEALAQRHNLFQRAVELPRPGTYGIWSITNNHRFRLVDNKAWATRDDLPQLYESYFRKMRKSDHVVMQALGEREAANYALWILKDKMRAMVHYRRFIQLIVEEIIPNHPKLADKVHGLWLNLNHRTGYSALTKKEVGELWSQVIRARWSPEKKCPKSSQPWEYLIKKTMLHLEKAGEIEKADRLLQACIEALQASLVDLEPHQISSQWQETLGKLQQLQQGLGERHSELAGKDKGLPTFAVDCQPCLTIEQMVSLFSKEYHLPVYQWSFSGIVPTAAGHTVTCSALETVSSRQANKYLRREWLAVAHLDKRGDIRSTSLFPKPLEYDYRNSRLIGVIGQFVRPLASARGNIFVSVPSNGIVWFPPTGTPIHFSSKYLEQPGPNRRPVPFEEARQLTPIDGKLYFKSGKDPMHPLIYELDYKKGKAAVLLDTRSLPEESPLWARIGFSITNGPPGKLLVWALPDGVPRNGKVHRPRGGHLFTLDLQDKTVRQVKPPIRTSRPWFFSGAQHHLGLRTSQGDVAVFNPKTLSMDWLIGNKVDKPHATSPLMLSTQQFVSNKRFFLTSIKKSGGVSDAEWRFYAGGAPKNQTGVAAANWLLYENGANTPQRLEADNLPSPEKVWQYLIDDQGQVLMVTNKKVFRIKLPADEGE